MKYFFYKKKFQFNDKHTKYTKLYKTLFIDLSIFFHRDSTYLIHVESLNCILIVLSIQMYTIQPSSNLITYRYVKLKCNKP